MIIIGRRRLEDLGTGDARLIICNGRNPCSAMLSHNMHPHVGLHLRTVITAGATP